jgi:PAS domain S-box-containing protein
MNRPTIPHEVVEGFLRLLAGDLSYRLPAKGPDGEPDESASFFNQMAVDLERLAAASRAHEERFGEFLELVSRVLIQVASGDLTVRIDRDHGGGQLDVLAFVVNSTIDELQFSRQKSQQLIAELRSSEARYRGVFESASVGIFQIEADGQIIVANQALSEMLGYQDAQDFARQITDFYGQVLADPTKREGLLRQLEQDDTIRGVEVLCRCKNGETIHASLGLHTIHDKEGALLFRQGTLEDISERRRLGVYSLDRWSWPLVVRSMGGLALSLEGQQVQFTGKVQKRPLQLLELLVIRGGRQVPEGWLADVLWPDAEGDAATCSLSTTIHRLRQLAKNKEVLLRRNSCLTLDRGRCWVDAWALEDELRGLSRLRNVDMLAAAAARIARLYGGPFMPQSSLGAAVSYRESLFSRTVDGLKGVVARLEAAGERDEASTVAATVDNLERSLESDA